jgi:hypothetical protein
LRGAARVYPEGIERHVTRCLTAGRHAAPAEGLQRVVDAHAERIDPQR